MTEAEHLHDMLHAANGMTMNTEPIALITPTHSCKAVGNRECCQLRFRNEPMPEVLAYHFYSQDIRLLVVVHSKPPA